MEIGSEKRKEENIFFSVASLSPHLLVYAFVSAVCGILMDRKAECTYVTVSETSYLKINFLLSKDHVGC